MDFNELNLVNTLNEQDVIQLLKICNEHDLTSIELNLSNRENGEIIDWLYYENNQLIGYLVIYPSIKSNEAIIMGLVHPSFRKKGLFTFLFERVTKQLRKENKNKVLFIISQDSSSGKLYLESKKASLFKTTYNMYFDLIHFVNEKQLNENVRIYKPNILDLDDLVCLGVEAFGTTELEERPLAIQNIINHDRSLLVAKLDKKIVGMIVSVKKAESATIIDFAVLKDYRRKGIGKTLLNQMIKLLMEEEIFNIRLSVESSNNEALKLYQDIGFQLSKANDFYEYLL